MKIHTKSSDNFFACLCPAGTECILFSKNHYCFNSTEFMKKSKQRNLLFSFMCGSCHLDRALIVALDVEF